MSADSSQDGESLQVLRSAIELGYTHIDTAEMYGDGHTEELVGKAIREFNREDLFITSKIWQVTLDHTDTMRALEGSLRRLGTDYLDLYLIHRPNRNIPLGETFRSLNKAVMQGKVKHLGVSNFDLAQLKNAQHLADTPLATNQVPYNLHDRRYRTNGVLQYCQDENILLTAYSPLERGYLLDDPTIEDLAEKYSCTPAQVALSWLISQQNVIALPMSTKRTHLQENLGALDVQISEGDLDVLEDIELPEEVLFPV